MLPEIQAPCHLHIRHKRCVLRIVGVDVIVHIDEHERVAPTIRIEEFECRGDTVGALVSARRTHRPEVVIDLQVRACLEW